MPDTAADEFLRAVELRLLRCTFFPGNTPPPPPAVCSPSCDSPDSVSSLIQSIVASVEQGDYARALSSEAARRAFDFSASWEFDNSVDCAERFYEKVARSVEAFLGVGPREEAWLEVLDGSGGDAAGGDDCREDEWCRATLLMCVAVAALMAFLQQNMTGPPANFSAFPLPFPRNEDDLVGGGNWGAWARSQLSSTGSDLFGKFSMPQYIVFANILLSRTKGLLSLGQDSVLTRAKTIDWWLFRVILLQQRILDERSSSLYKLLEISMSKMLHSFGDSESVLNYWHAQLCHGEDVSIVAMAHLEAGIMENIFGRVDSSRTHFDDSEKASGLQLSLTGVLGFRTVHQVDAKAQMVLVNDMYGLGNGKRLVQCSDIQNEGCDPSGSNVDCDIRMAPKLVENGNADMDGGRDPATPALYTEPLTAVQQAIILAQCLHINRTNPDDELSRWKVAPFIEAIDAQQHSHFSIRCFCDILRIRWEFTRGRTKQRAVLMMHKLVERVSEAFPGVAQRIQFYFAVQMPTLPALRKEYGELLVSTGLIGEAIQIFEELELWDNLINCYCLLGKKSAAVDLIKARLADTPDPKLWCSLGDVTNTDLYYEKALEVSGHRSARAKRSLARSAYKRGDYERAKVLWESALALNSLFPDGWFALGAAALKARDLDKAVDAFSRAVQLDPDNGEAWNNIACLHMVRKKSKESFIAFQEALKFRRTSWQVWQNYSHVAMDIGKISQALEATRMVLDLSANKQIDIELLERVMSELEQRTLGKSLTEPSNQPGTQESIMDNSRETNIQVEVVGKILQQIIRNNGDGVWNLYSRWQRIKGDLKMCSEALLKEVRSYQGSDLWHDYERFKKFTRASIDLSNIYMEISSTTGSHRELSSADMHLRNSIKQAAANFSNTEELKMLESCLAEVRKRQQEVLEDATV